MASTILVKDVLWRVCVLLQDTVPQFQRWPEIELVNWLNDAQDAIAKFLPAECSRLDAVKLSAGTCQSIDTILAANCKPSFGSAPSTPVYGNKFLAPLRNMGADGLSPGRAVRMVDRDVLDSQDPDWHTRTGTRIDSVMFDELTPRTFWVSPGAGANTWLQITYMAQPTRIPAGGAPAAELYKFDGVSTATISISDANMDELVDYVVARANMKDTNYASDSKQQFHSNRFLGSINARVTIATGVNPNLRLLPGINPEAAVKRGA